MRSVKAFPLLPLIGVSLSACTSVSVQPLEAAYRVKHICIRENPKVVVADLVPVITDGLTRHHIASEFIPSTLDKAALQAQGDKADSYYMNLTPAPDSCEFSLTYTARQSWDIATYLSSADIEISNKSGVIASANYHLVNKGGLSLLKWQDVKTKIAPVMDELLKFYP